MFCTNCGLKLNEEVNFCPSCGNKVFRFQLNGDSRGSFVRESMNCRKCNGAMKFIAKNVLACPYCGYQELVSENRDISISKMREDTFKQLELEKIKAFKELERMRAELDYDRAENSLTELLNKLTDIDRDQPKNIRLFHRDEDMAAFEKEKQKRKVQLIKTYPLPRSLAGLKEFLRVAEAHIDVKMSKKRTLIGSLFSSFDESEKELSDTWMEKYIQIFSAISRSYHEDSEFPVLKTAYNQKMVELNR